MENAFEISKEFMKTCGPSGIVIVLVTTLLIVLGIVLLSLAVSKKTILAYALLAFLPLAIGFLGTHSGYKHVELVMRETPGGASAEVVAAGRLEARYPSYLGLGGTVLALLFAGASLGVWACRSHRF